VQEELLTAVSRQRALSPAQRAQGGHETTSWVGLMPSQPSHRPEGRAPPTVPGPAIRWAEQRQYGRLALSRSASARHRPTPRQGISNIDADVEGASSAFAVIDQRRLERCSQALA